MTGRMTEPAQSSVLSREFHHSDLVFPYDTSMTSLFYLYRVLLWISTAIICYKKSEPLFLGTSNFHLYSSPHSKKWKSCLNLVSLRFLFLHHRHIRFIPFMCTDCLLLDRLLPQFNSMKIWSVLRQWIEWWWHHHLWDSVNRSTRVLDTFAKAL